MVEVPKITLSTLGGGAAEELFQVELQKVLNNIVDENTVAKTAREVTLKVVVKPDEKRDFGTVLISCASKLAPLAPFGTNFFIGKRLGRGVAQEHNPKQAGLFDEDEKLRAVPSVEGGSE